MGFPPEPNNTPPPVIPPQYAQAHFQPTRFDEEIDQNGYDVIHEIALECPCREKGSEAGLTGCRNCGGSGWVFVNPHKTRMLVQAMSYNQKNDVWSADQIGTARITAKTGERLKYLNRITIKDIEQVHSEHLVLHSIGGQATAFTVYYPTKVLLAFCFFNIDNRLSALNLTGNSPAVIIQDQRLIFPGLQADDRVTVYYSHLATYHVTEIVREQVKTRPADCAADNSLRHLPTLAIGRRADYMQLYTNADGSSLFNNTTLVDDPACQTETLPAKP